MKGGQNSRVDAFVTFASFVLVTAILYFAKAVFMPFAMAILFTFLLSPLVVRLQKWKFPKPVAIMSAVTLTFAVVTAIAWIIVTQLVALAGELPKYEENLHHKVRSLKGPPGSGVFTRAADIIKGVQKDFEETTSARNEPPPGTDEKPVTVEVKAPKPNVLQTLRRTAGPLLTPIANAGMVLLLVVAMLFNRENLRDRFLKVASGGQVNVGTEALDDAARRTSRYLLALIVVNVTYGIPIGVGLYFIGVPSPLLWGVLATLLRFIPFVGPWIAASFPLTLAFAADPGWSTVLLSLGLFLVIELISNNLVEPWLYGSSTGISSVAVIAGAIFWTWLWGAVGLFLATPLTVCLISMGKYVSGLRVLNEIFGSDCVLEEHERFYQRMLAMDSEEMLRRAEKYIEENDLVSFYDQVLIPALIHAEEDRQTGKLAEVRQQFIVQSSRELIEEFSDRAATRAGERQDGATVLCVPARDDADEIVAEIVAQLLRAQGARVEVMPATAGADERHQFVCGTGASWICISALPPDAFGPARRLCRYVKQRCPNTRALVGVWTPHPATTELTQRFGKARPDAVVTTVREAVAQMTRPAETPEQTRQSVDDKRQRAGHSFLRGAHPNELFDLTKRETAKVFEVPISLVSIVDMDREFWNERFKIPADASASVEPLRESALASQVTSSAYPQVVSDVAEDKRCSDDRYLVSRGVRAYAVAPLRTEDNHTVGMLCVFDTKPRDFEEHHANRLQEIADELMLAVEARNNGKPQPVTS